MLAFSLSLSLRNLNALPGRLFAAKQRALQAFGDDLAKEVKAGLKRAPNGSWSTGTPKPSKPGEAPGIVSGRLLDSVVAQMRGEHLAVGVPKRSPGWYAAFHEHGGDAPDDQGNPAGRTIRMRRDLRTRVIERGKRKGQTNERRSFESYVSWLAANRDADTGESLIARMDIDDATGSITVTRRVRGAGSNQYRTRLATVTRTYRNTRHFPERPFVRPVLARHRARIVDYFRRTLQGGAAA